MFATYSIFFVLFFPNFSNAQSLLTYQCSGKRVLAAVQIEFLEDDWKESKTRSSFRATTNFWIDRDETKSVVFERPGKQDFFRENMVVNGVKTDIWDYNYDRMVFNIGGSEVTQIVSPNGTSKFYTLNLSNNMKRADLVMGHADTRSGPSRVCILGLCGRWKNEDYNARCTLQE
jgi:hypothetical protein